MPTASAIDHLVYTVPDLELGIGEIERVLGVRPGNGGRHPDYGTRNALVALGRHTYLEIIAPDHDLPTPARGRPFGLDAPSGPRLATWVLRDEEIESRVKRAGAEGLRLGAVRGGARRLPDGSMIAWKASDPYAMVLDGAVPFLIAWGSTPHPAASAPVGGELTGLRIEHPDPGAVRAALGVLGVALPVRAGPRMRLVASIGTAAGSVEIS